MKKTIIKFFQKVTKKILDPTIKNLPTNHQTQILLYLKYRELAVRKEKLSFEEVGFDVYSPTHEDGIFLYIFSTIGTTNKKCIDIGSGSIQGSSVANLIINHGFKGLLIEGNPKDVEVARKYYQEINLSNTPLLKSAMITSENINSLLSENNYIGEIDLFCLDIDGVDYWIWKALDVVQPRVVMVEYQDLLGPERAWTVPYSPAFSMSDYPVNQKNHNYCGASLSAFIKLGKEKGYRLIGCNNGGWNAFFMKNGIGEEMFPEVSAESCFKFDWNFHSIEKRFPLVKDMQWVEV